MFEAEQQVQLPLMSAYLFLALISHVPFDPLLLTSGRQYARLTLCIFVCLVVYAQTFALCMETTRLTYI